MDVFTNIYFDDNFSNLSGSSVTIGNFDGCHLGHQNLIKTAIELSESSKEPLQSRAITFNPTAEQYFSQQPQGQNLFSQRQKIQALSEMGLDSLIFEAFGEKFSKITHQDFFHKLLIGKLNSRALAIGYDFRFGHDRLGDFEFLYKSSKKQGVILKQLNPVKLNDEIISSSKIRSYLQEGNISHANRMLGRPYMLIGKVKKGDQIGRTINVPTANLHDIEQLVPAEGVYCGWTYIEDEGVTHPILSTPKELYPTILNIGTRPTISANQEITRCEIHILDKDFGNSLYGKNLRVYFQERIRAEKKFADVTALKNAITKDIDKARKYLNRESL